MVKIHRMILPVLILGVILSGCGIGSPLAQSEPITLRYAYEGATPEIEALLAEFQDSHPNITVELLGPGTENSALMEGILNGNIDLIRGGAEALSLAQQRLLLPLDEVNLDAWTDVRDDYIGGLWESLSMSGEQYGIPAGLDTVVTFVNTGALTALGEALPASDAPWDNFAFLDLATRLNHPEGLPGDPSGSVYGFCSDHQQLDPFVFVYANGGSIVDDLQDPQRPTLDDAVTVESLAWYVDLFGRYGVAPGPEFMGRNYGAAGLRVAQAGGRCGLWVGMFSERGNTSGSDWEFDWDMLPVPGSASDLGLGMVEGYFVPRDASHPEEALQLARFLSDHWRAAGRLLPPRRSLVNDPAYERVIGERLAAQVAGFSNSMTILSLDFSPLLVDVGMAALGAVDYAITQNADIVPLLQEAQQKAEKSFTP